jgi:class 3 adenylate cyclase/tetratricopeptide (TPR) repeat protein
MSIAAEEKGGSIMSSPTLGTCSSSGSAQFLSPAGLNGYVPRWLLDSACDGAAPPRPRIAPMRAAVVFADISGFSRLTRLYQEKGEAGVEELSLIIGDYLGKIIERVFAWGGDVENIYGDALLAFWPETGAGFKTAMAHALGCAADIVGRHDLYEAPGGVVLRVRAAAVAGDLFFAQAGVSDDFVFMLTGACLLDIEAMLGRALPGQIAASPALRAAFTSVPELSSAQRLTEQTGDAPGAVSFPDVQGPYQDRMLHAFVPATVRRRNQLRSEWLAEFRRLAVLCIGIPDLLCRGPEDLAAIQDAVATIQTLVHRFEGGLIRMSMSDKGPMALIAFGLPDQAHDDDPIRAVRAAQEIVAALAGKKLPARGTVTFGLAYCGVIGNRDRHTYTAMGDTVNLAAKLLSRAELSSITCDEAIMLAAGHRVDFEPIRADQPDAAALYRPLAYRASIPRGATALIGRTAEIAWLRCHLDRLGAASPQPVLYIEGEPGIGKSTLIAALTGMAAERCSVFSGAADPLACTTSPYAAWVSLFTAAFAAEIALGPDTCEAHLRASLARQGVPSDFVRLAGVVLPSLLLQTSSSNSESRDFDLSPDDLARVTRETLSALLRDRLGDKPGLIVIDDVHWMDSASWLLASQVVRDVPSLLLVLAARPDTTGPDLSGPWSGLRELAATVPVERLRVEPLSNAAIADLLVGALGCARVSQQVVGTIQARAAGNPLFAVQLALSLREQGALNMRDGLCRLAERSSDATSLPLPESIQRAMLARIDRLPADLQMTLKVASVIGMNFSRRALAAALRLPEQSAGIGESLERLTEIGVTGLNNAGADAVYSFDHALTQEAAYQLLPFALRRQLHAAVAGFLEAEPAPVRRAPALLGLHWSRADQPNRALPYWEQAGTMALSTGAYREAAAALREAIGAVEAGAGGADRTRHGRLHRLLGEALLHSGEVTQSARHLTRALDRFGFPWFDTPLGTTRTLVRHLFMQISQEIRPAQAALPLSDDDRIRQAAMAFESLGQALGHQSKLVGMATATLAALNLSKRIGDTAAYSRAAGLLSLALLLINMPGLAGRYLGHSRHTAPDAGRPHDRLMTIEYIALFLIAVGRLSEAEDELHVMIALADEVNNRRRGLDATSLLFLTRMARGEFSSCAGLLMRLSTEAEKDGDKQLRCWVRLESAGLAIALGDFEVAERHLRGAGDLLPSVGLNERVWTLGLLALVNHRLSRPEEALGFARQVMDALVDWRAITFYAQDGVFGAAEVFLDALEHRAVASKPLRTEARIMMRRLARFGMRLPLTRIRSLILLGRYAALLGRPVKAMQLTQRALAEAEHQHRPVEQASAQTQLERINAATAR